MCGPTDPALVLSPPRLQRPSRSCLAHKALSALSRNLDQLSPQPTVTGRSGGPRSPRTRNSGSRSRRTRGGLAQHWGRGFRFSVHLTHYLRPPGRDFSAYRESPVNLIRFGPQARKGASVKRAPASLLLRICGLCGHRCAAQGELGVFQDKIFTARSQRNAQILWILPVNICWDVYALGGSVRKLCRIGLWCSELPGLFC